MISKTPPAAKVERLPSLSVSELQSLPRPNRIRYLAEAAGLVLRLRREGRLRLDVDGQHCLRPPTPH